MLLVGLGLVQILRDGLEGEPNVLVDPQGVRGAYLREFNAFTEALERGCREIDIDLVRMPTDQPIDQLLSSYLAARMRPGNRGGVTR